MVTTPVGEQVCEVLSIANAPLSDCPDIVASYEYRLMRNLLGEYRVQARILSIDGKLTLEPAWGPCTRGFILMHLQHRQEGALAQWLLKNGVTEQVWNEKGEEF